MAPRAPFPTPATSSSPAPTTEQLAARVAELEAIVASLVARPAPTPGVAGPAASASADAPAGPVGRRALLGRLGVAAAAGAGTALAAGALTPGPAGAANFDPVLAGTKVTSTNPTEFDTTSAFASVVVTHGTDNSASALFVEKGSANNNGRGIYCNNASTDDGAYGIVTRMGASNAKGTALYAYNNGSGFSIDAHSNGGSAILARGTRAGITLKPLNATGPSVAGLRGELRMDARPDLYLCTADGLPTLVNATWRRVMTAAPGFDNANYAGSKGYAGSINLLNAPFRLFDTRAGQPVPLGGTGKLQPSTNTDVQVTGTVPNGGGTAVPAAAIGVLIGLTVTGTGGAGGFLKAFPTGVAVPNTSVINWSSANQNLAVTTIVRLGTSGRITLRCGTSATDAIVDVVGFLM